MSQPRIAPGRSLHPGPSLPTFRDPPAPRSAAPPPRRPPPRRRSIFGTLGTALVLGAALLVVAFIVVPLLQLGQGGGGGTPATSTPVPTAAATPPPGQAQVPDTIGMAPADAIAAATAAGLNWTLQCIQDESLPPTIYDQEPPAGTLVAPGSRFTMFSPRIEDCE